jgi:ABC-type transport system involved in multi-copper enzyme maturation permease subunit
MIWLTWRQFRTQGIVAAAAVAVLAVIYGVTGPHLADLYSTSGIATCGAHSDCGRLASSFLNQVKADNIYELLFFVSIGVLYLAPGLIGVFWGAPLITRELETGTFRLAWNQSVTRTRWLAVKLGLIGLAAMATAGLLSLLVTWWASPINKAIGSSSSNSTAGLSRIDPLPFGAHGIAPVGYAAFAFVLGVTAGVLIRRTVPAMAATLVAFAGIQIVWPNWIRPHLISPVTGTVALNPSAINELQIRNTGQMTVVGAVNKPGAWVLSNQTISPDGHVFTGPATHACLSQTGSFQACQNSLGRLHLRQLITYQPASRYWVLQWYETAIFLALAVVLAGYCYWRIRRRA